MRLRLRRIKYFGSKAAILVAIIVATAEIWGALALPGWPTAESSDTAAANYESATNTPTPVPPTETPQPIPTPQVIHKMVEVPRYVYAPEDSGGSASSSSPEMSGVTMATSVPVQSPPFTSSMPLPPPPQPSPVPPLQSPSSVPTNTPIPTPVATEPPPTPTKTPPSPTPRPRTRGS